MELPGLDVARIARLQCALAGGALADARDRELAGWLEGHAPHMPAQFRAAGAFSSRAALWAVAEAGASGVLFAATGLPCGDPPHLEAAAAVPSARFAYAASDPEARLTTQGLLAGPQVTVTPESARDPEALMGSPAVAWLGSPLHVQLPLAAHFWPPEAARKVVAVIAGKLPKGSSLALTLWSPGDNGTGRLVLSLLGTAAGARAWGHSAADVAGWLEGAGLALHPAGIAGCAAWPDRLWAEPALARTAPGRVIEAVGVKG